jgi:hypothetical protein
VKRIGQLLLTVGFVAILSAAVMVVWPLHANGVSGSALVPHYKDFGFQSYVSLPRYASLADLRRAGLPLPQDAVAHRRDLVYWVLGCGIALAAAGSVMAVRGRRSSQAR